MNEVNAVKLIKPAVAATRYESYTIWDTTGIGSTPSSDVDKFDEEYSEDQFYKAVDKSRFYYKKDPIASTVLNKIVEIGISDLILEQGSIAENEFKIYKLVLKPLQKFIEACALEYLISGLVIPEIKYSAVKKSTLSRAGIKKYDSLTLPVSMWLRDPKTVIIKDSFIMDEPAYYVRIPDETIVFIMNEGEYDDGTKDKELYEKLKILYPEFVTAVKDGGAKLVPLEDTELITRRKVITGSPYPIPYLMSALESLRHKRNLRRMDYSIAARVISAIMLIKLGNDEYPVTEDDEDAFTDIRSQMSWKNTSGKDTERIFQLFGNHTLDISWVFPDVDALLNDAKYVTINQDIFYSLGFPKILTTGETERSQASSSEFATLSPVKTMENMQDVLIKIADDVMQNVVDLNGFKSPPDIRFDLINLKAFADFVEGMNSLYDSGNISRDSYVKAFGYDWEEEMRKKEIEQATLEKLNLPEFSPQPYSPQPGVPNKTEENPNKTEDSPNKTEENPNKTEK